MSNMPKRGLVLVGISTAVAFILGFGAYYFEQSMTDFLGRFISPQTSVLVLFLVLALVCTFATELLSNTVVQLVLFALIPPLAKVVGFPPLLGMIVATLASSSAFMSPLSTGINSLVFGEMKGASLRTMVFVGFFMNIIGSLLVALWVLYITRWVLAL